MRKYLGVARNVISCLPGWALWALARLILSVSYLVIVVKREIFRLGALLWPQRYKLKQQLTEEEFRAFKKARSKIPF